MELLLPLLTPLPIIPILKILVAGLARGAHLFVMVEDASEQIDRVLYKGMPKSVIALNRQARKEARLKKRAKWAAQNPDRIPPK